MAAIAKGSRIRSKQTFSLKLSQACSANSRETFRRSSVKGALVYSDGDKDGGDTANDYP